MKFDHHFDIAQSQEAAEMRRQLVAFTMKPKMAKASASIEPKAAGQGVVLAYKRTAKRPVGRAVKVGRTRHAVAAAR